MFGFGLFWGTLVFLKKVSITCNMETNKNLPIKTFSCINDFLMELFHGTVSNLEHFYCQRIKPNMGSFPIHKNYVFKNDFYLICLATNVGDSDMVFNNITLRKSDKYMVIQTPNLLYNFSTNRASEGYIVYFKKEIFDFFKPNFDNEFPMFNYLETFFLRLSDENFDLLGFEFEQLLHAYNTATDKNKNLASCRLLALLYLLKDITQNNKVNEKEVSANQIIYTKYINMVNNNYLTIRTVEEYAELLNISANHLSKAVKASINANALSIINKRIINEAISMLKYSEYNIAEIAYHLNFSDTANFGKFFKRHIATTPLQYRNEYLKGLSSA
jgi:AraC family transcriptional regulator, transcriptional activator of pobA